MDHGERIIRFFLSLLRALVLYSLSKQCRGHKRYTKSSTFKTRFNADGTPSLMNVQYLSGSLRGYDGTNTICSIQLSNASN